MKRLVIFGVSNMLSDLFDCALARGYREFLIVENVDEVVRPRTRSYRERIAELPTSARLSVKRMSEYSSIEERDCHFLGTTAAGRYRMVRDLRARLGIGLTRLIHPAAYVSPLARLSEGVFVGAGSVIAPSAVVHECAFINRAASIGHDTQIGPYARVQPGANVGGHVRIGAFVTLGIGAVVFEEIVIDDGAYVSGGAVVTADVAAGHVVAGVPAVTTRILRERRPTWRQLEPHLSVPTTAHA